MMKRIAFCFDGTWAKLEQEHPTNVVITAESILPLTEDGTAQLIYYDEGVGTGPWDQIRGGLFGEGLDKNLSDAYRFLIFNYSPGDEIYVFGFSRGAFTARSFVGLIANSGIMLRRHANRVSEALDRYRAKKNSAKYKKAIAAFRDECSPTICVSDDELERRQGNKRFADSHQLTIKYVGVWDTVGSLGIPKIRFLPQRVKEKYQFHDVELSPFVESARHALGLDERRIDFEATEWENMDKLNKDVGKDPAADDAPYQQQWFPGVHGSVGGGGERRGLSDLALDWILDGARAAGLKLDTSVHSRIFELQPNHTDHLVNSANAGLLYTGLTKTRAADRVAKSLKLHNISLSARHRWKTEARYLPERAAYRPSTLGPIADQLDRLSDDEYGVVDNFDGPFEVHVVERGDTLQKIAKKYYGKQSRYPDIMAANRNRVLNADRIFPGWRLRIPTDP